MTVNKTFTGERYENAWIVSVRDGELGEWEILDPKPSQKIVNHSPDGFAWGYGGSGPSQLALAILLEVYGEEIAERLYQEFKWDVIANLDMRRSWCIDYPMIEAWKKSRKE